METMRYNETKKSSKGFILGFLLFVIIGGTIIYFSIRGEKPPMVVGKDIIESQNLVDIYEESVETSSQTSDIGYSVTEKIIKDSENPKIKSDIKLPVISINNENLTEINNEIYEKYTELFNALKESMSTAENKFTYKITYNTYENIINSNKILSITIYQRVTDDSAKKNTTEKIDTYNINIKTKKIVKLSEIAQDFLGKDYKTIINSKVKQYVLSKSMMSEEAYTYALTGFENCYIKESKFHIIFNEDELVAKKYSILDITI